MAKIIQNPEEHGSYAARPIPTDATQTPAETTARGPIEQWVFEQAAIPNSAEFMAILDFAREQDAIVTSLVAERDAAQADAARLDAALRSFNGTGHLIMVGGHHSRDCPRCIGDAALVAHDAAEAEATKAQSHENGA